MLAQSSTGVCETNRSCGRWLRWNVQLSTAKTSVKLFIDTCISLNASFFLHRYRLTCRSTSRPKPALGRVTINAYTTDRKPALSLSAKSIHWSTRPESLCVTSIAIIYEQRFNASCLNNPIGFFHAIQTGIRGKIILNYVINITFMTVWRGSPRRSILTPF